MGVDGLPNPNRKDLDYLRSSGRRRYSRLLFKILAAAIGLLFGALIALYAVHHYRGDSADPSAVQQQLLSLGRVWSDELADSMAQYRDWMARHGTATEAGILDDVIVILGESALSVANSNDRGRDNISLFSSLYLSLHGGVLRLVFLVLASLRLWIVTLAFAIAWGINSYRVYRGADVLGQAGNGRLFYSGIRVGLDKLAPDGAPDMQVRGLACPEQATPAETRASPIWPVLQEYGALNATNEALVSILVKYKNYQPYVTAADEEELLKNTYSGTSLEENAAHLLAAALSLHALYAAGDIKSAGLQPLAAGAGGHPYSSESYALLVRTAMHRVLTPELRSLIAALNPDEVATTVLGFECGKVLAHSFEGGKWIRRSNFPQLSARAILHSVVEYPQDYAYEARNRIRRALIYGSRRSSFAPVRMPLDLTEDTWALRQWVELLMACPHELEAVADEVEMAGLVRTAHQRWIQEFLDGAVAFTPDIAQSSYSTPSNLLFVPLERVITLLRKTLDTTSIRRLEYLVSVVSSRQRLHLLEAQNSDQGDAEGPSLERILPLLSDEEINHLAPMHGVSPDVVRDWSALRIVLTSYGWLARRVGDYSVADSSVIFAVFRADPAYSNSYKDVNALGLLGRPGMVPFRGSKLEERWGRNWAHRFLYVGGVTMAESTEDYEKLLAGIKERDELDALDSATA